ncbi:MAG: DUF805 domain-containing protein [Pseudomonadota bacterium]
MLRYLFSPYGRTNRRGFWLFIGIYIAVTALSMLGDREFGFYNAELDTGLLEGLVSIVFLWPSIAVSVRRLHDLGYSGWWLLWVMLISIVLLIGLGVLTATLGFVDFETFLDADGQVNTDAIPAAVWGILAVSAAPYLIQMFMLAFVGGQEGENRFDRHAGGGARARGEDTQPWNE